MAERPPRDDALDRIARSDALRAARRLLARRIGLWAVLLAGIAGFAFAALNTAPKQAGFLGFLDGTPSFVAKSMLILVAIILIERVIKAVTSQTWFDRDGAASEMALVRERVGGEAERANDAIACAIQLGAIWIFRGLFILAYFGFFAAHS